MSGGSLVPPTQCGSGRHRRTTRPRRRPSCHTLGNVEIDLLRRDQLIRVIGLQPHGIKPGGIRRVEDVVGEEAVVPRVLQIAIGEEIVAVFRPGFGEIDEILRRAAVHVGKKAEGEVIVIAGKDKGKRGTVKRVLDNRFVVSGVNMIKRHTKPNPMAGNQGGIVEREAPIHASNVAIFNAETGKADRVGFQLQEDGTKVRIYKSTQTQIDA